MGGDPGTVHDPTMTTLHLEVPINDLAGWKAGFAEHVETRNRAGVRSEQVRHPVGDESLLFVDLEFGSAAQAEDFLGFLQENIWKDQPILAGTPKAWILEPLG